MSRRFPDGFRWGSATSAYQIEGAVDVDGRGSSIWDTFAHTPGTIADGSNGDIACDHYHRYRDDVGLMADLGLQDYRFSIAWPRVQPSGVGPPNAAGLDFYSRLVEALLERDIRPVVTLYHWDLPQALQDRGGWAARETAERFAEYAAIIGRHLGDRVETFTTLNEPWCSAFLGHASGAHAPGVRDAATAYRVAHHLLLGHGRAAAALRAELPTGREVSITVNPANVRAATDSAADVRAARIAQLATNQVFLDPLLLGELNAELVQATVGLTDWSFVHDGDLDVIAAPIDLLGINYYNPHLVGADAHADGTSSPWPGVAGAWSHQQEGPTTGMGWPVEPESMTELLLALAADYPGVPFSITENGAAYDDVVSADGSVDDQGRAGYLATHVSAVRDAIEGGVDIRAYYAWSLLDNFEWAWGLAQRFGIVHVDFDTQVRTLKASALAYRDIISSHGTCRPE
ncbi:MAG: GH1 family beta-glucosidase [Allobranchiibius sp.]